MYPQVFGKYILERELARGGMARVVLATLRGASGFEKKLVVKQIRDELAFDDDFIARFVEEAKTTVALNHPNIVPVYELGMEQGTYFIAMELVLGVSLTELIRASTTPGRGLSPEEGAYVGVEVCRALDYAHRRMNVVHRDITPRNVMIDEEGQVRIIDFGIAARASDEGREAFGTLGHMPPEQMDGRALSPATDVFAIAVLLMEAWSGSAPFRRKTRAEVDALLEGRHPKPSDTDILLLPLDDMVGRGMLVDPRQRPQAADDLGRALRKFLAGTDVGDIAQRLGERVRELRQKGERKRAEEKGGEGEKAPSPSKASYADVATRTFAVREEAQDWSDWPPPADVIVKTPLMAFEPMSLSLLTQRLAAESAAAESAAADGASADGEGTRRSPSPSAPEEEPRPDAAGPPAHGGDKMPTTTRVRVRTRALSRDWTMLATGGLGVAAVLAGLRLFGPWADAPSQGLTAAATASSPGAGGSATSSSPTSPSLLAAGPATSSPPVQSARVEAAAPAAPTASALPAAHGVATAPSGTASIAHGSSPAPSAAPSTPPVSARVPARLSFLGDPGTRVFVDGVARGPCPLRDLAVEPGARVVRFVFEPTGEVKEERLTLEAAERLTLRADFAGATPTIRRER